MSSFRNAVRRREHRERAQPGDRSKYGLLEKHKDYVLRAKDFQKKRKTIQTLQEKASQRNPDEFYYKMINSMTVDGVHRRKGPEKEYSQDELMLMKTQDIKYVLGKAQSEQKKVERLQSVLHSVDEAPVNKHLYFAEDRDEAAQLQTSLSGKTDGVSSSVRLSKELSKARGSAYRELAQRKERLDKLKGMVATMSMQKEIMGKGRKRKLRSEELPVPSNAPVFRWRSERKK